MTESNSRKILLIGWDAADWKVIHPLLDKGEMPNLARLIEGGVMGDITTLEPVLSPMLWNSIATGKYADQHGILGFTEVDPVHKRVRPVTSTSRRTKAIWNILMQNGYRTHVIHWFGGHPAEPIRGVCVSDSFTRGYRGPLHEWNMVAGTVHPPECAQALDELRVRPDEIDEQLLTLFVPRAAEIDQDVDRRLATLAKVQAECISVHAAATWAMENHPWDFTAIYYPSIDHFSHAFMNFHPPRLPWVDEKQFEFYKDVVNSGYRFHDLMLGQLMRMAPPETTIILCSDHGFHSDHLRPKGIPRVPAGPAEQHRPLGVLVMSGPGIRKDELVYGATLLDICPTILNLCGLAAGKDMPGRVLLEAMENPRPIPRIGSWDLVEGDAGMHTGEIAMEPADAEALIEQFVALGYIEKPDENQHQAVITCERERMWNLARVYLHSGRPHLALPVLEGIWDESPDRVDYGLTLARCQMLLGMTEEARATAAEALEGFEESPAHRLALAQIALGAGQAPEALAHLEEAAKEMTDSAEIPLRLGAAYLRLRRPTEAEKHILRSLEIDPHNPDALELLARAYLRQKRWQDAAEAAVRAVGFEHYRPLAHLYLGIALMRMDQLGRAIQAYETALSFRPPLRLAHFWLSRALWRIAGRQEEALKHRSLSREARERRLDRLDALARIRQEAADRARERAAKRAQRRAEIAAQNEKKQKRAERINARRARIAERRKQAAQEGAVLPESGSKPRSAEFVIVSGLPRSGTSLMMQMLHSAGVEVMTDARRAADVDNPRGYFEWEEVKKLPRNPEILMKAEGKAVKVISMLLPHLPLRHKYKVIFMDRPIDEVAASHSKMIRNRNEKAPAVSPAKMKENLERHRRAVLTGMERSPAFDVMVVSYPDLVREPAAHASRIVDFLGPDRVPHPEAMLAAVDPALHRNRS